MEAMEINRGIFRRISTEGRVVRNGVDGINAVNTICDGLGNLAKYKLDSTDHHVHANNSNINILENTEIDFCFTVLSVRFIR